MLMAAEPTPPPTNRQRREARRRWRDAVRAQRRAAAQAPLGVIVTAEQAVLERDAARAAAHPRKLTRTAIERLLERGAISADQAKAADRFHRDWYLSGSSPRVIAKLGPGRIPGGDSMSEAVVDARRRFEGAVLACGPRCLDVVVHVCLIPQTGPYDWDVSARRRRGTGLELLREGLQRLVEWYG